MITQGLDFNLLGQDLVLLPEKAIYWKQQRALIAADVHLGKVGHFRKAGIAVPQQLAQDDLVALTRLIQTHQPKHIYFLGDLFHSDKNTDWNYFAAWREQFASINIHLIIGNHDIIDETHYHQLNIATHESLSVGPFLMLHHPLSVLELQQSSGYVLCGHVHPGVKLVGKGRQGITLPCFTFGARQAILPSFGKFTGRVAIRHLPSDHVFGVLQHRVIAM
ncbi:ligase-associated DNA damage response endonuclease PdeM [Mucilaginibacter koreensis]